MNNIFNNLLILSLQVIWESNQIFNNSDCENSKIAPVKIKSVEIETFLNDSRIANPCDISS